MKCRREKITKMEKKSLFNSIKNSSKLQSFHQNNLKTISSSCKKNTWQTKPSAMNN